ncbi:MAG: methyltransferase, partial [Collinsella sp.]
VLSPEAAARQRVELPWNDEVEQARKAEAALAEERATAERRAANLTAADEAALGGDVLGSRAYAEELADREAEEAAAQAAEAEAAEAAEPELDEYGIAIEGADQETASAQDAASPAPAEPRIARVLEVGCGTGCISLSLAWERRGHITCTATDIEPRAIDLATKNRDALGLTADEVAFSLTNLVSSIPREEWGTFDVLVSNPPYIPPMSCARCRTRSRTLSPTWRSRAAPTASIFSAACSMRRPTCCAPAASLPASSTRAPSMPRPSSVARQAFRTCVSSMTSPIAPASSEPSSPSPNSVFKLN